MEERLREAMIGAGVQFDDALFSDAQFIELAELCGGEGVRLVLQTVAERDRSSTMAIGLERFPGSEGCCRRPVS